jgi:hypothetical protein
MELLPGFCPPEFRNIIVWVGWYSSPCWRQSNPCGNGPWHFGNQLRKYVWAMLVVKQVGGHNVPDVPPTNDHQHLGSWPDPHGLARTPHLNVPNPPKVRPGPPPPTNPIRLTCPRFSQALRIVFYTMEVPWVFGVRWWWLSLGPGNSV